jgi:hypothetical protein
MNKYQQRQKKTLQTAAQCPLPWLRPADVAVYPDRGVCYQDGNWAWKAQPPHLAENLDCTACHRIAGNAPAGRYNCRVNSCINIWMKSLA